MLAHLAANYGTACQLCANLLHVHFLFAGFQQDNLLSLPPSASPGLVILHMSTPTFTPRLRLDAQAPILTASDVEFSHHFYPCHPTFALHTGHDSSESQRAGPVSATGLEEKSSGQGQSHLTSGDSKDQAQAGKPAAEEGPCPKGGLTTQVPPFTTPSPYPPPLSPDLWHPLGPFGHAVQLLCPSLVSSPSTLCCINNSKLRHGT